MYDVIFAAKSESLIQETIRLRIWGEATGFFIRETVTDFRLLEAKLRAQKYDLLLLEHRPEEHTVPLLRKIKEKDLCGNIVVLSEHVDFWAVRKSFLLGVNDYLVSPLKAHHFISLFSKIENQDHGRKAAELCRKEELLSLFENVDFKIKEQLDKMMYQAFSQPDDAGEAIYLTKRIIDGVVMEVFEKYEWLKYYFSADDYLIPQYEVGDLEEGIRSTIENFYSFFQEFAELYPCHGEGLEEVLQYILNHPEGDLKQKTISEELYMNRSYLSTVFTVRMGSSFVDYVNTVKMKRAAFLLKHTKKKVIDIADALDYKDMGYFLKRFKGKYGVTPSQYRIPEDYEFHI